MSKRISRRDFLKGVGTMMGAPDWAHWHGFFMLQQKMYLATEIYEMRKGTGEIEAAAPWSLAP